MTTRSGRLAVHVAIDGRGQDAARSTEDGDNGGRVDRVLRQRTRVHQFVMHLQQLEVESQTTGDGKMGEHHNEHVNFE